MLWKIGAMLLAGTLATVQAPTATAPAPDAAAPAAKPDPLDHVSCRQDQTTGSIMIHKTCHTKREWLQMEEDRRKEAVPAIPELRNTPCPMITGVPMCD
jgi:hypothetical protein